MMDAKLEPDYVYEENPPEVARMRCPELGTRCETLVCEFEMDTEELLAHYKECHPQYWGTDIEDIEIHFEQERTRRYGR